MSENLSHTANCEGDAVNLELVQEIFGNMCVNCASFVAKKCSIQDKQTYTVLFNLFVTASTETNVFLKRRGD